MNFEGDESMPKIWVQLRAIRVPEGALGRRRWRIGAAQLQSVTSGGYTVTAEAGSAGFFIDPLAKILGT
jgi:hypothetical protein